MKKIFAVFFFGGFIIGFFTLTPGYRLAAADTNSPAINKIVTIDVSDNIFSPESVTIFLGDTIKWQNKGFNAHNVISNTGAFNSGAEDNSAWVYEFTPTTAGIYDYFCAPHELQGMIGSIEVRERFPNFLPLVLIPN